MLQTKLLRCVGHTAASASPPLITTFITDLEGDGLYFDRYVANSKVVRRDPKTRELSLADGCRFVYGGDLYDKGTHDMRLCKEMLALKAKYPDRVTFILGNRDLQKHKFLSLLHPSWWKGRPIDEHTSPYYMNIGVTYAQFLSQRKAEHCEYSFLNWLVNYCYGAANSLTRTRQEMYEESVLGQWKADGTRKSYAELRDEFMETVRAASPPPQHSGKEGAKEEAEAVKAFLKSRISNEEVLSLYKGLVDPANKSLFSGSGLGVATNNIMAQYADQAQLAAVHDGVLYVHGAVKANIIGYIPDQRLEERLYAPDEVLPGSYTSDLDEWVQGLNRFYTESLAEWRKHPGFEPTALQSAIATNQLADGRFPKRGASALYGYGHSRSCQGKSVIINSFFSDAKPSFGSQSHSGFNDLNYVDMKTVTFLGLGGVSAVMTGHQPASDVPLVINQPGLRVVCGDTSYCDGKGGRGQAVTEVLHSGEDGDIRIHGTMADGQAYDFEVEEDGPRAIGRRLGDGWWTRGMLKDGRYIVRRTKDRFFTSETKFMSLDEIEAEVGHQNIVERSAVVGEDAALPFKKDDLRPIRNHEKSNPDLKTKKCCGSKI